MTIRQKEGHCDYIVIVICNSTYFLLYIFVVHLALFCTTIYYTNTTTTFSQYYQLYGVVQCLLSPIPLVHTTLPMYVAEYRLLSNDYSDFVPFAKLYVGAICVCFTWQVSSDCSFALFLFWTKFHPLLSPPRFSYPIDCHRRFVASRAWIPWRRTGRRGRAGCVAPPCPADAPERTATSYSWPFRTPLSPCCSLCALNLGLLCTFRSVPLANHPQHSHCTKFLWLWIIKPGGGCNGCCKDDEWT